MSFIGAEVLDAALQLVKSQTTEILLCSTEPFDYSGALAAQLASGLPVLDGPESDGVLGRRLVVIANTLYATVSASATHWALVGSGSSLLFWTGSLAGAPVALAAGTYYSLDTFYITFPGAA